MKKVGQLIIIILILSILLVSGCLKAKEDLENSYEKYIKQLATPTPTPTFNKTPTITPINTSTLNPTSK